VQGAQALGDAELRVIDEVAHRHVAMESSYAAIASHAAQLLVLWATWQRHHRSIHSCGSPRRGSGGRGGAPRPGAPRTPGPARQASSALMLLGRRARSCRRMATWLGDHVPLGDADSTSRRPTGRCRIASAMPPSLPLVQHVAALLTRRCGTGRRRRPQGTAARVAVRDQSLLDLNLLVRPTAV
jgi:hypothetical protein